MTMLLRLQWDPLGQPWLIMETEQQLQFLQSSGEEFVKPKCFCQSGRCCFLPHAAAGHEGGATVIPGTAEPKQVRIYFCRRRPDSVRVASPGSNTNLWLFAAENSSCPSRELKSWDETGS